MKIIEPSHQFEPPLGSARALDMLSLIEAAARTCYKSEAKTSPSSASAFVRSLVQTKRHLSPLEHVSVTLRLVCDRGVSHELVRHRLASYCQESTRYCNYSQDKFGREITVIRPPFWGVADRLYLLWENSCRHAEEAYFRLLDAGATPQEARSVLPNSLKTEVVMTANLREWRHVLELRCAPSAHPQMRQLMRPVREEFVHCLPEVFEDLIPTACPRVS
jgi:thymidylate synthase (FAD)